MATFVLKMINGPNWDSLRQRREQDGWAEHAAFMDKLVDAGFVFLGGPVGDGEHVLLIVEAADEREIQTRLSADPWLSMGLLRIGAIERWTIWLDGRQSCRH